MAVHSDSANESDRLREEAEPERLDLHGRSNYALVVTLLVAALIAGVAFWAGTLVHGSAGSLPQHVTEPLATVGIRREVLTETVAARGRVVLPAGRPVVPLAPELTAPGAQAIVTGFRWRPGMAIANGDVLAEVAGQPIFVLAGVVPAYRDLEFGDSGDDVVQLQAALRQAGYTITDPAGSYGPSTAMAVAQLYEAHSLVPPESEMGSVADAQSGGTKPAAQHDMSSMRMTQTRRHWAMLPVWSVVYVKHLPAIVAAIHTRVGERLSGERAFLRVTDHRPVVHLVVGSGVAGRLAPGMTVKMRMSGQSIVARLVSVLEPGAKAKGADSTEAEPRVGVAGGTYAVVGLGGSVAADIRVGTHVEATILVSTSQHPVFVVPLSVVDGEPTGHNYIEVERARRIVRVAVVEGMTANGEVAISAAPGAYIKLGERVVVHS